MKILRGINIGVLRKFFYVNEAWVEWSYLNKENLFCPYLFIYLFLIQRLPKKIQYYFVGRKRLVRYIEISDETMKNLLFIMDHNFDKSTASQRRKNFHVKAK